MIALSEFFKPVEAKRRFFSVKYKFLCCVRHQIAVRFNQRQRFDVAKVPRRQPYRIQNLAFAVY
jgi:hypothetical protein